MLVNLLIMNFRKQIVILEHSGKIPTEGVHLVLYEGDLKLTVLQVEERRIAKILIEKNINENKG